MKRWWWLIPTAVVAFVVASWRGWLDTLEVWRYRRATRLVDRLGYPVDISGGSNW